MTKRRLCSSCSLLWRYYIVGFPGMVLDVGVHWTARSRNVRGFRLLDPFSKTDEQFYAAVEGALTLIAESDAVRFARVQGEIRTIVKGAPVGDSGYGRPLRSCYLGWEAIRSLYGRDGATLFVAGALVRESTLGHLIGKGIVPTRRIGTRVDDICCRQAARFLRRVGMEVTPWDPEQLGVKSKKLLWRHGFAQMRRLWTKPQGSSEPLPSQSEDERTE